MTKIGNWKHALYLTPMKFILALLNIYLFALWSLNNVTGLAMIYPLFIGLITAPCVVGTKEMAKQSIITKAFDIGALGLMLIGFFHLHQHSWERLGKPSYEDMVAQGHEVAMMGSCFIVIALAIIGREMYYFYEKRNSELQ